MNEQRLPRDPQDADSRADAIAALSLILIAVAAAIYFVSGQ